MKKILLVALACSLLAGCDFPEKTGESVHEVQLTGSRVDSDGDGEGTSYLYVTVQDTENTNKWEINLGDSCANYPFVIGSRYLVRFDDFKQGEPGQEKFTYSPQDAGVYKAICGTG